MAGIQTKRFSFFKQPTYWQQLEARRERGKVLRERAQAVTAELSSVVQSTAGDQMTGAGDLAAKAALKRIEKEAEAKLDKARAEASAKEISIWKNKAAPSSVTEGGTTVDLAGDTVTLSDGTTINLKTGKPAGNFLKLADGSQIDLNTGRKVINIVT
jgi:hypothetical protein